MMSEVVGSSPANAGATTAVLPGRFRPVAADRLLSLSRAALTIAVILVLSLCVYLIRFARPKADDFYRGWAARGYGLFSACVKDYRLYSGRWLSTTLNYTNGWFFDLYHSYPFVLLACMLGLFGGFYLFIGSVLPALGRGKRLGLAAILMAFYWTRMPQPGQSCYWMNGAFENELSIGILLAAASVLLRVPAGRPASVLRLLAVALSFFIAAGGHELYGALTLIPITVGAAVAWGLRPPERAAWVTAAVALLIGVGFVAAAPGNRLRGKEYPNHGKLSATIRFGTGEASRDIPKWTTDGGLWLATACLLLLAASTDPHPRWLFEWFSKYPLALIGTWVAGLGAGFYIPAWALGNPIPPRTINCVYCFFLFGWFALAIVLANRYRQHLHLQHLAGTRLAAILQLAFAIALLSGPNFFEGITDATSLGPRYAREADERHRLVQAAVARHHLDLTLQAIKTWPRLSMQVDMPPDPNNWQNVDFSDYHGLHSVVVILPPPTYQR